MRTKIVMARFFAHCVDAGMAGAGLSLVLGGLLHSPAASAAPAPLPALTAPGPQCAMFALAMQMKAAPSATRPDDLQAMVEKLSPALRAQHKQAVIQKSGNPDEASLLACAATQYPHQTKENIKRCVPDWEAAVVVSTFRRSDLQRSDALEAAAALFQLQRPKQAADLVDHVYAYRLGPANPLDQHRVVGAWLDRCLAK